MNADRKHATPTNASSAAGTLSPVSTTVTVLTPPGRGAVATLEISGPGAAGQVSAHFEALAKSSEVNADRAPQISTDDFVANQIVVGYWGSPVGREQVVIARRASDCFEVHCHGGRAAVEAIAESLVQAGARRQNWQAWIAACESDPLAAAARRLLADAPTLRVAGILLDQVRGALSRAIADVRTLIARQQRAAAVEQLQALLATVKLGEHLTRRWRVVLAGPPNAGKSSLINALVGYERSIVARLPGTTRDVLSVRTAIDGWPVELADTAGLSRTSDPLEQAGIALARSQMTTADVVLWLMPCDGPSEKLDAITATFIGRAILVRSKCDLLDELSIADSGSAAESSQSARFEQVPTLHQFSPQEFLALPISAHTGAGMPELLKTISERLVPSPPAPGSAVIFAVDQRIACVIALAEVERGNWGEADRVLAVLCQRPPAE